MTLPIKNIIVRLKDGTVKKIEVGDGEGFFREEVIAGPEKSVTTHQCFIAGGIISEIQSGATK